MIKEEIMDEEFLQVGGKAKAFHCSNCNRDIALLCRIKCAVCSNVNLCADCFAVGVQLPPHHEPYHSYRVVDNLEFPIFVDDWTVAEELLLLEGIDKFGAGNWKTISEYIGTKGLKQTEDHYWQLYMGTHGSCLPKESIINGTLVPTSSVLESHPFFHVSSCDAVATSTRDVIAGVVGVGGTEAGVIGSRKAEETVKVLYSDIPLNEGYEKGEVVVRDRGAKEAGGVRGGGKQDKDKQGQDVREKLAQLPGSDLPGFLPLREDFDVEYENDAELILADMEFSTDDHPSEKELKLQVIAIYNNKLDERNRRKRFVIDRGLVDIKKQQIVDRRRSKEERELVARLRVFSRFQTAEAHEALVEGLLRARKLRNQIESLQLYRQMGVRSLEQAKVFEVERKRREDALKARRQREQAPYLYETGRVNSQRDEDFDFANAVAASISASSVVVEAQGSKKQAGASSSSSSSSSSLSRRAVAANANAAAVVTSQGESSSRRQRPETIPEMDAVPGSKRSRQLEDASSSNASSAATAVVASVDLTGAPGYDLLVEKEKVLCSTVPLMPLHYLAIKDVLVREAFRNGSLTPDGFRRVMRVRDTTNAAKVFDFFVRELRLGPQASFDDGIAGMTALARDLTAGSQPQSGPGERDAETVARTSTNKSSQRGQAVSQGQGQQGQAEKDSVGVGMGKPTAGTGGSGRGRGRPATKGK